MPKYTFTIESPAVSSDGGQGVGEGAYGSKDRRLRAMRAERKLRECRSEAGLSAMDSSDSLVRIRAAALLAAISAALLAGALAALLIGWFWAKARGDWQAVALWSYWFGAPVLSAVSIAAGRGNAHLRRLNLGLLGTWIAASILTLLLPFLG